MFDPLSHAAMLSLLAAGTACLVTGALIAPLLGSNRRRVLASILSQVIGSGLVLVAVLPICFGGHDFTASADWSYPIGTLVIRIGPLGAFFLAWSLPMTLLGTIYARGYLEKWMPGDRNVGVHFSLLNMIALSFVIIYTVENAMLYLLGWEIAAISAWLLVIWDYQQQRIRFAGFNYLVSTHVGLIFLVAAFMLMFAATGSLDFAAFREVLTRPDQRRTTLFILLCASFALKSAFFPFHSWLPRAHAAAPAHVSALMSGVIHKAGLFGLLKFTTLLGRPDPWMGWALLAFGALSAVMGVVSTASQRDLKRILGYSSTENVGIVMMGVGVGYLGLADGAHALTFLGFASAALHVLNHALFKCLLFYGAGAVYKETHTVDLELLGGVAKAMPMTAALFLIGSLAISGMPLFNGFASEFLLYSGLFSRELAAGHVPFAAAAAVLAFVGAVSSLSMTRCFGVAFLGSPRSEDHRAHAEAPWAMRAPMLVHALLVVCIGLVPTWGLAIVEPVASTYLPADVAPVIAAQATATLATLVPITLGVALALTLLIALRGHRARADVRHVTWGCGYGAPTPRMQYSATSFAAPFLAYLKSLIPHARTETPPAGVFPRHAKVATNYFDAAERRIFQLLRDGEALLDRLILRLPERSTSSFALGLIVLVAVVAWLVKGGGS